MWKEFKEFATKGNVLDLAIGVIIGGGFQKIVTSFVNDIMMPLISLFIGKVDFNDRILTIGNTSIRYGSFITNTINFLITALVIFFLIRYINKLNRKLEQTAKGINQKLEKKSIFPKRKKKKESTVSPQETTTKQCPYCLSEIAKQATRCPHCTSVLDSKTPSSEELTDQLKFF